ncbi:MAG TPA: DUF6348 family protein [Blastocatellia bacterium]|nr:DUF6348 family protein [Blastocatellia bacterium]
MTKREIVRLLEESHWQAEPVNGILYIRPLDLEVTCEAHSNGEHIPDRCINVTARHAVHFPDGIIEHCFGYGGAREEIAADAAAAWVGQAFYVIHDFLCSHSPDSKVKVSELVTFDADEDKVYGWKAFFSPMIVSLNEKVEPDSVQSELVRALCGSLSTVLLDRKLHWLKCYVGVVPGHSPSSECRFDNEFWPEGTRILSELAMKWPAADHYQMRKQFLLFKPCEPTDLKNGERLIRLARAEVTRPNRRKLSWQFWKKV